MPPAEATSNAVPLSGRRAQAARNDQVILDAARAVFLADPAAPVSAVAEAARVGMSALYRRYPSKEDLLRRLCLDGLAAYTAIAQDCVDDDGDPWEAFATFMRRQVEAGSSALVIKLAGTFTPNEELNELATHAGELNVVLFDRTMRAGVIRPDLDVADMGVILEQLASITLGATRERNLVLRLRYLELILDGLRAEPTGTLPGPTITDEEFAARWVPKS